MKTTKQNTQTLTGAIVRFTTNKHNDVDGLVIDQQGDLKDIKFPPHTARFIRDVAAEGDTVQLMLQEDPHPPHRGHRQPAPKPHLAAIANPATRAQFTVDSLQPPHPPESGPFISFDIPKPQFTRGGKKDDITGVLFEDKYIHLHPGEYEEGEATLASAAVLRVKAKKRIADAGFVNAGGYTVYHAHSIKVGEK